MEKQENKFYNIYLWGFCAILILPFISIPPFFSPPAWGKTILFRSILSMLLFLFIYQLLYKKDEIALPNLKKNKIIYLLSAILSISFLATIFSQDINFSLWGSPYRGGGFVNFTFYILFGLLSFIIIKNSDWEKLWNCATLAGILVSFLAIAQYFGWFEKIIVPSEGRPSSTMGNPIILGIYILLLFFYNLPIIIKEKKLSKKIIYGFILLLFLIVIAISGSRAAYLGLLVGSIFFILFYPKKIFIFKIATIIGLCILVSFIFYINNNKNLPQFLEENKIFQSIKPRLSIELFLIDPRFSAWQVIAKEIKEKPILGWGPENFSIGFDKYYDPSLPYISKDWGGWWDRAHNIFLDISATMGVPATIIYLILFIVLFWKLQKNKNLQTHAIQATLIAYLTATFFSFDTFSTYLIFFLIVAYVLHLALPEFVIARSPQATKQSKAWQKIILSFAFLVLIIFLWQYNLIPLFINAKINQAEILASQKNCEEAIEKMDNALKNQSFLNSYVRMEYVEVTKTCLEFYPEKNLEYVKKDFELIKDAVKIQPNYTRYWIFLGESATTLADNEKDNIDAKKDLLKQAQEYFDKATILAPRHQEIYLGLAKMEFTSENYEKSKKYSEKCIELESSLGDCWWSLGLSEIYLKNFEKGKEYIEISSKKRFEIDSEKNLNQLLTAYIKTENYQELISTYKKLIKTNPSSFQYHASLAFTYKTIGDYANAKKEALIVLELSPESKENVEEFLKTLLK